ncbi:M18 family aminopeptidase [Isoptericola croceus]|uniref:M18 family aminopeptidase n=1 Tax=Isoptericola croceus TaxID=3031406 RepID=UPI0023F84E46|nr:M18 family aminopeptidase [Isoptericola croceus]
MAPAVPHAARTHTEDLGSFVTAAPSSYHAVAELARRAEGAGFVRLIETDAWEVVPGGRYVVVRDGSATAFVVPPSAGTTTPFTVLGTHTDSPGFKLKPRPTTGRDGWVQAGVEVYGGPLLNSWLDRELELAGRVVTRDGTERLVRTGPFARIPQLAIHLDRQVNDGLTLDKQRHTQPVIGLGDVSEADVLAELAARAESGVPGSRGSGPLDPADIVGYDVVVADTQAPRAFGAREDLWASGRLDNLLSTHAALTALLDAEVDALTGIAVVAAFDHEEIGSESRSGAAGPFLEDVLGRVSRALGAGDEDRRRALAASVCVSSDVGHAVHPNYPERHDPANLPRAGGGPILKINANQRYSTDAPGAALWHAACEAAGVPTQEFVSNNAIPCGSTIGPITATRLGIRVVDVGVPILSMHSARELTAVVDPWYLTRAMGAVLVG